MLEMKNRISKMKSLYMGLSYDEGQQMRDQ
jgi:hypothetical protein